jgi:hypothetical protein
VRTVTVKPSGGDYTSLANAEAGEDATLAEPLTIECYAMQDAGQVYWDGWSTTNENNITVFVPFSERFTEGKWSDTAYRLVGSNANGVMYFNNTSSYVHVDLVGFQLKQTGAGINCHGIGGANLSRVVLRLFECILACSNNGPENAATRHGIFFGQQSATPSRWITVRNTLIYGFPAWGSNIGGRNHTITFYNVTIVDNPVNGGMGFNSTWTNNSTLTLRAKNVLVQAIGTNFATQATTYEYADNLSSDGTALGADAHRNATVAFEDAANHDYRLSASDTAARDQGTSLAADSYHPFTIDIAGTDRTAGTGLWDIGCFEVAAGPPVAGTIEADGGIGEIVVSRLAAPTGHDSSAVYGADLAADLPEEELPGEAADLIAPNWDGLDVTEEGLGLAAVTRHYAEYATNVHGTVRSAVTSATTVDPRPETPSLSAAVTGPGRFTITPVAGAQATDHALYAKQGSSTDLYNVANLAMAGLGAAPDPIALDGFEQGSIWYFGLQAINEYGTANSVPASGTIPEGQLEVSLITYNSATLQLLGAGFAEQVQFQTALLADADYLSPVDFQDSSLDGRFFRPLGNLLPATGYRSRVRYLFEGVWSAWIEQLWQTAAAPPDTSKILHPINGEPIRGFYCIQVSLAPGRTIRSIKVSGAQATPETDPVSDSGHPLVVPREALVGAGDKLYRVGHGYDDGGVEYEGLVRVQEIAADGFGGEAEYRVLYLTVKNTLGALLEITPILDGRKLPVIPLTVTPQEEPLRRTYEIPLFEYGSNSWGLRGTFFTVEIVIKDPVGPIVEVDPPPEPPPGSENIWTALAGLCFDSALFADGYHDLQIITDLGTVLTSRFRIDNRSQLSLIGCQDAVATGIRAGHQPHRWVSSTALAGYGYGCTIAGHPDTGCRWTGNLGHAYLLFPTGPNGEDMLEQRSQRIRSLMMLDPYCRGAIAFYPNFGHELMEPGVVTHVSAHPQGGYYFVRAAVICNLFTPHMPPTAQLLRVDISAPHVPGGTLFVDTFEVELPQPAMVPWTYYDYAAPGGNASIELDVRQMDPPDGSTYWIRAWCNDELLIDEEFTVGEPFPPGLPGLSQYSGGGAAHWIPQITGTPKAEIDGLLELLGIEVERDIVQEVMPHPFWSTELYAESTLLALTRRPLVGAGGTLYREAAGDDDPVTLAVIGSDSISPEGEGGECMFCALYLAISHSNTVDVPLELVRYVDDLQVGDPIPVVVPGVAGPRYEVIEVGLTVDVGYAYVPRGAAFSFVLRTTAALPATGRIVLEGAELEIERVQETQEAFDA